MLFEKDIERSLILGEETDIEIELEDSLEEGCKSTKEGCSKEGCAKEGCGSKKEACSKEACGSNKKCKTEIDDMIGNDNIDPTDMDITDDELEESMFFDDAYDVYTSVCEETCEGSDCETGDNYEETKKDAFAFGPTNDQIDGMIDSEISDFAQDTIPDNVNILGANTDDFEYNEDEPEDMYDDEDIEIVIDDEDIYGSDDK